MGLLAAMLLVVVGAAGCGGINANVPISRLLLIQNQQEPPRAIVPAGPALAVNDISPAGF